MENQVLFDQSVFSKEKVFGKLAINKYLEKYCSRDFGSYVDDRRFPVDMSLSNSISGCSPLVNEAIKRELFNSSGYPSISCETLRSCLSDKYSLDPHFFNFGFGADDILSRIIRSILNTGDEVISSPGFQQASYYTLLCGGKHGYINSPLEMNIDDFIQSVTNKTKAIFICNPNNPTGRVIPKATLVSLINLLPKVYIIVDEAGIEYAGDSLIREVESYPNLCIVRSLSKAYGLAGFRVGYAAMNVELSKYINQQLPSYKLTHLSEIAAKAALLDQIFLKRNIVTTHSKTQSLVNSLRQLGFGVLDTDSNIFLLKVPRNFSSSTKFVLTLNKQGAHVVDGNFFYGYGNFVRVSTRSDEINKKFLQIMAQL